jgi:hypothetical protein
MLRADVCDERGERLSSYVVILNCIAAEDTAHELQRSRKWERAHNRRIVAPRIRIQNDNMIGRKCTNSFKL